MFDAKELLNMLTGGRPPAGIENAVSDASAALDRGKQAVSDAANQAASTISNVLGQVQSGLEGSEASEYASKAKDFVDKNPIGTVAAIGGLSALLLGTKGGRAVTGGAAKIGGLAAIGGIAYKALRNYQEGKPLTQGVPGLEQLTAAPEGTSFSELAQTNDTALLLIRTMVATAAADGIVEPSQRAAIVGQLKGAGLNPEAAQFLDAEIQHPATVSEIATTVGSSQDLASQIYAAAHLIAATPPEKEFLEHLAKALALDPVLVAHINAAATIRPAVN
jgi:uncharacterized membrane protein YebE (DUF533 family)